MRELPGSRRGSFLLGRFSPSAHLSRSPVRVARSRLSWRTLGRHGPCLRALGLGHPRSRRRALPALGRGRLTGQRALRTGACDARRGPASDELAEAKCSGKSCRGCCPVTTRCLTTQLRRVEGQCCLCHHRWPRDVYRGQEGIPATLLARSMVSGSRGAEEELMVPTLLARMGLL